MRISDARPESMEKTIRTFIAFELPTAFAQLAAELQNHLQAQGLKLRWVRPQNIHLTLKFLGELPVGQIADVSQAMQRAAGAVAPFTMQVQGMGVFPGMRSPRVLWIGLGGRTDALATLHARLEDALADLALPKDKRAFKAHLTLARIDRGVDVRQLLAGIAQSGRFAPKTLQASELILFKSDLRPQGAVYSPLARAPLGVALHG
jgi:2'-5' RNA ligase